MNISLNILLFIATIADWTTGATKHLVIAVRNEAISNYADKPGNAFLA